MCFHSCVSSPSQRFLGSPDLEDARTWGGYDMAGGFGHWCQVSKADHCLCSNPCMVVREGEMNAIGRDWGESVTCLHPESTFLVVLSWKGEERNGTKLVPSPIRRSGQVRNKDSPVPSQTTQRPLLDLFGWAFDPTCSRE